LTGRRSTAGGILFDIEDTQKPVTGLFVHRGTLRGRVSVGESVSAEVDPQRRAQTMRNHTGTHLLHRALRNAVGEGARQAGSLVTPDYLRFDYPAERALSDDERRSIEDEVRQIIREDRPVAIALMGMQDAIDAGADAFFDEKYGETVRTIRVQDFSFELCGGTHCRSSGQVGSFVITSDRSIGSGMRRIEALTGAGADTYLRARSEALETIQTTLGAQTTEAIPVRITALQGELREARRRLKAGVAGGGVTATPEVLAAGAVEIVAGVHLVAASGAWSDLDSMKSVAKAIRTLRPSSAIALLLDAEEPQVFVSVSDDLVALGISAGEIVRRAVPALDGKGGGRPEMAQGRGSRREGLADALAAVEAAVRAAAVEAAVREAAGAP